MLSNASKLELYGWYKQATVGECEAKRPSAFEVRARAKHDAWAARRGVARAGAMREYLSLLERVAREHGVEK